MFKGVDPEPGDLPNILRLMDDGKIHSLFDMQMSYGFFYLFGIGGLDNETVKSNFRKYQGA